MKHLMRCGTANSYIPDTSKYSGVVPLSTNQPNFSKSNLNQDQSKEFG